MTDIHSCSYYCNRPECIKAQRDELRDRLAQPEQEPKLSCGVDYADGLLTVSVMRRHGDGNMEVIHCEQIAIAQPKQEPALTVDALRVVFERPYKGKPGLTRLSQGEYLSPAIEKEWQQFFSKYTSAPQRTWVGLTDEEVKHQWEVWRANAPRYVGFAKGIEAKLKEKNT